MILCNLMINHHMAKLNIDSITPEKSLIDLTGLPPNSLDSLFVGYNLIHVLDDIILAEFVDIGTNNNEVVRNGLIVPLNATSMAWRIGKVVLAGKGCTLVEKGDHICFPNNMGTNISNVEVEGFGTVKSGQFLNEHRIFGVVKPRDTNENNTSKSSRNTKK